MTEASECRECIIKYFLRLIENACLSRHEALRGAELPWMGNEHRRKVSNEESERLSTALNFCLK